MMVNSIILCAVAFFTLITLLITFTLAWLFVYGADNDNYEDDIEQMEYLVNYNKSRKGGTKDGNKTEKPEDSQS